VGQCAELAQRTAWASTEAAIDYRLRRCVLWTFKNDADAIAIDADHLKSGSVRYRRLHGELTLQNYAAASELARQLRQ
jgi:hypothetical protein